MKASNDYRAALFSSSSSFTISIVSCVFQDCKADKNGGAIYLSGSNTLTITDSLFHKCISNGDGSEPGGGGIFITGSESSLSVSGSIFLTCEANVYPRGGGGFFALGVQKCHSSSSRFISCSTTCAGGAIFFQKPNTNFLVSDTLFSGNSATLHGGAIRELEISISPCIHLKFDCFTRNTAPDNMGNDLSVHPDITTTPFLYCLSTATSNRAVYTDGINSHEYNGNWLPHANIFLNIFTTEVEQIIMICTDFENVLTAHLDWIRFSIFSLIRLYVKRDYHIDTTVCYNRESSRFYVRI